VNSDILTRGTDDGTVFQVNKNNNNNTNSKDRIEVSVNKHLSKTLSPEPMYSSSSSTLPVPVAHTVLMDGWITGSCRLRDRDSLSRSKQSHATHPPGSSSSDKERQLALQDPPTPSPSSPVTIERTLLLRSPYQAKSHSRYPAIPSIDIDDAQRSSSGRRVMQQGQGVGQGQGLGLEDTSGNKSVDKRHFRKNFVRAVNPSDQLSARGMDRVLPKESERELQVIHRHKYRGGCHPPCSCHPTYIRLLLLASATFLSMHWILVPLLRAIRNTRRICQLL